MSIHRSFIQAELTMMRHTVRWSTFLAVIAISTGCGGSEEAVDEIGPPETGAEVQEAEDVEAAEDDGVGEFTITMSGDRTGEVTGTQVQCMEFRDTRSVTFTGEHNGESLDVALSDETFDDGTIGKAIVGGHIRSAGQGGTLTIDENGATFADLEVGTVTISGSAAC